MNGPARKYSKLDAESVGEKVRPTYMRHPCRALEYTPQVLHDPIRPYVFRYERLVQFELALFLGLLLQKLFFHLETCNHSGVGCLPIKKCQA